MMDNRGVIPACRACLFLLGGAILFSCGCSDESSPSMPVVAAGSISPASAEQVGPELEAQGGIQFVRGYQAGVAESRRQVKPMLVFFTAKWCTFCHQMCDEAFTHDQVVNLSQQFVCVLVDADDEPNVCQDFRVRGYPTVQFVSPRGVPLNRVIGKKPGHQLVIEMQAALQAVARRNETGDTSAIY